MNLNRKIKPVFIPIYTNYSFIAGAYFRIMFLQNTPLLDEQDNKYRGQRKDYIFRRFYYKIMVLLYIGIKF